MFQLASAIPDKEILWKPKPKPSSFVENLIGVPLLSDFFNLNNLWDSIEFSFYDFTYYDDELTHLRIPTHD